MPVALHLRFPAGRYHATGWGHHVNEAALDWPPAPFRLLRALYAQAFRLPERPERERLASLFGKLARPPAYRLPDYTEGHTRHYVPTQTIPIEKGRVQVLDAFAAVRPTDTLVAQWDAKLSPEEEALLGALAGSLTYLGRAESWCEAVLGEPVEGAVGPGEGEGEPVSLLALSRDCDDVLASLDTRTDLLRKKKAATPPGTTWVRYFVKPAARPVRAPRHARERPTAALFQLDAGARPRILDAVEIGHRFRRALLSKRGDGPAPVLSGKQGREARESGHRHAHYLPFDLEGDGRITHLLLWAEEGFDAPALEAMSALRRVWRARDREDALQVKLLDVGPLEELDALPLLSARGARRWRSHTPFLLMRHPKRRGGQLRDGPEDQLRRELAHRGLPEATRIERLDAPVLRGPRVRWLEYRRWRGRHSPAVPSPYGFRIELGEPIRGPLSLGFGAHFGLGLFVPDEGEEP
ncbi:MAG TPA: type I-U CRISPR-associated protein Csb2 [Polyangiaceae bacterium LLY-WYZ-15_(1-7)]|nr:type I-U CRISPR-associated protein Cas5/Cas6 [Sandaracinus sp.]HJK91574.1 type I-U CRISPR-associated protein Csb2 [Polyangiaceae bacterium LLY-WYZ-15_(1-7)]MBJ75060.1 type I-U CRISPR-associated protein Cas5/Cas6 [Sandaracinus sp.]HJL03186.1 type I-U CRISPR-associated protein Csb2 [Polyangiaceae bacterium LLY-WYZ-15_(1-7)]HJL11122.1 type I-U CRISPR-associated protein Csb2 [Polyangiaceae bacterium LLY-WYZ-15_(1-7)]